MTQRPLAVTSTQQFYLFTISNRKPDLVYFYFLLITPLLAKFDIYDIEQLENATDNYETKKQCNQSCQITNHYFH